MAASPASPATSDRPLVIHHAPCPDGFGAAYACGKGLGRNVDYVGARHKTEPPDVAGREVLMLDYCYAEDVMAGLIEKAKSVKVIDHHADKVEVLRRLKRRFGAAFGYLYDADSSGATMAWRYFNDSEPPALLRYIEDRDLWRNDGNGDLPFSREVNALVAATPYTFVAYDALSKRIDAAGGVTPGEDSPPVEGGRAILGYVEAVVGEIVGQAADIDFPGVGLVPAVNCNGSKFVSEVAGILCKGRKLAVSWYYRKDGHVCCSLRSDEASGTDVSKVAKQFGGGGHKRAAGFEVACDAPVTAILKRAAARLAAGEAS